MPEHSEVIPNGETEPIPALGDRGQPRDPDWRNEPRKSKDERFARTIYARVPISTKDALRRLASLRGETEARYLRDLITRETQRVLHGIADAPMPSTPAQTKAADKLLKSVVRAYSIRSPIRKPKPPDHDFDW